MLTPVFDTIGSVVFQSFLDQSLALVALVLALILLAVMRSARFKGWIGEVRVNAALSSRLDKATHTVFRDVTLPTSRGTTQIDHIVIAPTGVFVIETKCMSGWIFGSADQSSWTQSHFRKRTKFQNPLRQNYKHIKAVEAALDLAPGHIHGLVAFVGSATPRTAMPETVVWGTGPLLRAIGQPRDIVLTQAERERLGTLLKTVQLAPGQATRRAHVAQVRQAMADRGPTGTACPSCGGPMVPRMMRKTGTRFMGCARYPACRSTRQEAQPR